MRGVLLGAGARALPLLLAALGSWGEGAAAAAPPGPLAVSASIEPAEIRVGDTARLTVAVDHPAAGSVELPQLDQGRAVVPVNRTRETVALEDGVKGGRERTTFVVTLTSFVPGERRIGAGAVRFTDRDGGALETPFPDTSLRTKSVLRSKDDPMRGVKGPARWPAPRRRWLAPAAALLLVGLAILLGVRRRKPRRREKPALAPPPLAPREAALKALAELGRRRPTSPDAIEPWYRELSSVVRGYVEERLGLRAPEETTEEFIREAAGSGLLAPAHQTLVRTFLEQCDLVKFARRLPPADEASSVLDAAVRLVRETGRATGEGVRP